MSCSELLRFAGVFSGLSGRCQGDKNCPNEGGIFVARKLGWYCEDHAGYCEVCNGALLRTEENISLDMDFDLLHEDCKEKIMCPSCFELTGKGLELIKDRSGVVGCTSCSTGCYNCNEIQTIAMMSEEDGDYYCNDCFDELFTTCLKCSDVIPMDDALDAGEGYGCEDCYASCEGCNNAEEKSDMHYTKDDFWCSDCHDETFFTCEECGDIENSEDSQYGVDGDDGPYCNYCWGEKFTTCSECSGTILADEAYHDDDGATYCRDCKPNTFFVPEQYKMYTGLEEFSFSTQSKNIRALKKIVPISIKELKKKYPKLASSSKNIIIFSSGKNITEELLDDYEINQPMLNYNLEYSGWHEDLQRSVGDVTGVGQLVLNLTAPDIMIETMQEDRTYDLFELINKSSEESEHPFAENQIGWARLELDEVNKTILVDEIQSDHMNALGRIYKEKHQDTTYAEHMRNKWGLSVPEMHKITEKLKELMKSFPDVIIEAISAFAKTNGFKKIYWHTYESGNELKGARPPKSLYTSVPKRNYFIPTDERPFDLDGKFLARFARKMYLKSLIRKLGT